MSLLFIDGFDHYNPATYGSAKWDNTPSSYSSQNTWLQTGGRRGGGAMQCGIGPNGDYWYKTLSGNFSTIIVGMAIYWASDTNGSEKYTIAVYDGSTIQVGIKRNYSTGYLEIYRGDGVLLGTYSVPLSLSVWYYIELKVTIHDTVGAVQLRISESLVLNLSNIDTKNSGNAYANKIGIGSRAYISEKQKIVIDDLYICNDSGTVNNDFLGDCRIDIVLPTGAGYSTQWTPSAGSNYQCVDDSAFDEGTDYISDSVLDHIDSYTFGNLPTDIVGIKGVQTNIFAKRTDSGVVTKLKPILRPVSTNYEKTEVTTTINWYDYNELIELNPETSVAWIKADIDAMEVGLKLTFNS